MANFHDVRPPNSKVAAVSYFAVRYCWVAHPPENIPHDASFRGHMNGVGLEEAREEKAEIWQWSELSDFSSYRMVT